MANDQGPKKVGVYDTVSAAGINWMWVAVGLIVLAVLLYLLFR